MLYTKSPNDRTELGHVLVMIDGWSVHVMEKKFGHSLNYRMIPDVVRTRWKGADVRVYYYAGVLNETNVPQQRLLRELDELGYHVVTRSVRRVGDRVHRSGIDVALSVDAVNRAWSDELRGLVLISGSGIFVPLLEGMREHCIPTMAISTRNIDSGFQFVSEELTEVANVFVDVMNEPGLMRPGRKRSTKGTPEAENVVE